MMNGRQRASEIFEALAVLHLHALTSQGERGETNPQLERVLSGLQRMSKEDWSEFLSFAEQQRVYLRTLQLLEKWDVADAVGPRPFGLQQLAEAALQSVHCDLQRIGIHAGSRRQRRLVAARGVAPLRKRGDVIGAAVPEAAERRRAEIGGILAPEELARQLVLEPGQACLDQARRRLDRDA